MHFWVINEKKTIIFFSSKCGSTTVYHYIKKYYNDSSKTVYKNPLILDKRDNKKDFKNYKKYKDYKLVIISRNPYHKLVSAFLDKYIDIEKFGKNNKFKNPDNCNSFNDFVNILTKDEEKNENQNFLNKLIGKKKKKRKVPLCINFAHFKPQTHGLGWDLFNKIKNNNKIILLDIKDLNKISEYLEIENFNLESRKRETKNNNIESNEVWNLDYQSLKNIKTKYCNFYNDNLKKKIYEFYKNDFLFFRDYGIDYKLE